MKLFTLGMVAVKEGILRNFASIKESIEKKDGDKKEW